ncbi:MFS transporter [Streptomyces sp. TRM66268-LWL]|uniref:MFS transporter n=1 Tax=Streptomyces polyasparticus TaxID=2767826 RepID=A0ABR7SCR7_9ACTN|nr:MFS transporter [Streptomyces polyasparticus]MBC9713287.1 MFS transporter [Streptomyces polyasparticus]
MKENRYRVLVAGYAVSSYGTFLNVVALNLYVYAVTDRALAVGVFMAVRLAAGFLAGLVAATVLSRWAAKPVMLWANVVQAAALLLLVCAPDGMRTASLFVVSAVIGGASTLFMVAFRSSIPDMVEEGRHTWANSLMVSGRSLAMVAGFASSGVVVSLLGYTVAFLVDMVSFLVCAATVALLQLPTRVRPKEKEEAKTGGRRLPASLVALGAAPVIALMVALRGIDALGSSSHNAALPVYSSNLDTENPAVFVSVFWCVWALGNVLVQQVVQRYVKKSGRSVGALGFGLGTIAMSATFILAFAGFPWVAVVVIALLAGAADGVTEVSYSSHLQTLPAGLRTHAFGLSATVENLGFGVGMIAVAAALDVFSPLAVVGVAHGLAIVVAVAFVVQVLRQRSRGRNGEGVGDDGPARGGSRDGAEVSGS